jgi:hypothetical protein
VTKIERSIVIERPVEEVWEFVHDPAKDALWQTTLTESEGSAIRATSGPIPFSGGYRLEPAGAGTSFTVHGELDAHGFFKLAEPVFARIAGRELETNLAHLKDLLEAS